MINDVIFRTYDLRGEYGKDFRNIDAYLIVKEIIKMLPYTGARKVCVGYDGRLSSPLLLEAIVDGISTEDMDAVVIGLCPTPMLYFADRFLRPFLSIMITGSHNPKEDNGLKIVVGGQSFYGENIQKLKARVKYSRERYHSDGIAPSIVDIKNDYIAKILESIMVDASLRVAWDPGNGAVGAILRDVLQKLPNDNIIINEEVNGTFPHHHPDPTVFSNLSQLIEVVGKERCDVGIAFDGDGDRMVAVTHDGKMVFPDQLLCLFAKDILKQRPRSTIIGDIKSSQVLFDVIEANNGIPIMWNTGHALIKKKMLETRAVLAGEMSGHIFFGDKYYGYDDGIYASLRLLDLLSKEKRLLANMVDELPKLHSTPEIKVRVREYDKAKIMNIIKKYVKYLGVEFVDIDGVRVKSPHGWWLIRSSNTEGVLIVRCEAATEEELYTNIQCVNAILSQARIELCLRYSMQIYAENPVNQSHKS